MITLMYVSISTLNRGEAALEVADVVEGSISRNAGLDVTGALLFTATHFAQVLEGRAANVDDLMASITRDKRHRHVTIVDRSRISRRRFADWQMAYQGEAGYVDVPIAQLISDTPQTSPARYVNRIYSMMSEFVRGS